MERIENKLDKVIYNDFCTAILLNFLLSNSVKLVIDLWKACQIN